MCDECSFADRALAGEIRWVVNVCSKPGEILNDGYGIHSSLSTGHARTIEDPHV